MKILYGVQGTGNGHISRTRKMAAHFRARGADVTYLVSGRPREQLFDMECFGNFEHRVGLTMVQRNGEVLYWATARETKPFRFISDVRALDVRGYDLVISDFEPVTAWAARLAGVTCVGIAHQYAFGHPIPRSGDTLASSLVMRYFAPVDVPIGLHWHHFDADILPPIIDTRLSRAAKKHILVYLPFEQQSAVTAMLQRLDQYQFVQYSPELTDSEAGNVSLRRTCLDGFRTDLRHAEAVITNAGFELVSECLHMGIPPLVKPVQGQMEQHSNAAALQQLGYGTALQTLSENNIRQWLQGERPVATIQYPDVAATLVDWVLEGDWTDRSVLWETLWSCTRTRASLA